MTFFDAHFHWRQFQEAQATGPIAPPLGWDPGALRGLSSCHDPQDWAAVEVAPPGILASFGIHPQWPVLDHEDLLHRLVEGHRLDQGGRLAAVGECGFDFFHHPDDDERAHQEKLFALQVDLALRHGLPVVIHLRRATDRVFRHVRNLRRLRAVVFHSWPGPANEALSLLAQGVPAFFSFGTTLLWGARKATETLLALPPDRILLETDAPWQPPRDLPHSPPWIINRVADRVRELRADLAGDPSILTGHLEDNVQRLLGG